MNNVCEQPRGLQHVPLEALGGALGQLPKVPQGTEADRWLSEGSWANVEVLEWESQCCGLLEALPEALYILHAIYYHK